MSPLTAEDRERIRVAIDAKARRFTPKGKQSQKKSRRLGPKQPAPEKLTSAELGILRLLADGLTNKEIAEARGTSIETVKAQVTRMRGKLGATGRPHAVAIAHELGLIS